MTRRAEQARVVTPDSHVRTIHSNSPPSMHSAPAERAASEALPPVLQSVGPQLPAAGDRIAQSNHRAPMREMQGENLVSNQPPPPGVHFGMPFPTAAPPAIPLAHRPQPSRSQPVAMYNDHWVPMVAPYPLGPYTHNVAAPFPQPYVAGFLFHGYAMQPHNVAIPQPQGTCQNPGQPPYGAHQALNHAPALSYSVEAPHIPHPQPDQHARNPNVRITHAHT
ncbi:leucine-rich repeat extensin-like protein 5 [Gastrolobium bilobum]|uniref:leucine-rich repeat extensin-like protein 5 n=1 Tax=Gastrolobium bilobum TaxID=150636 RepID=UPI002AB0339B|nr:leucine-rich repeat extensin-like protein 5 [Gastrolobium bilobum]